MKKRKRIAVILITMIVALIGVRLIYDPHFEYREPERTENSCAVYYLLNIDGMKGLGHSSFMLVDEQGEGIFYSYNGMQNTLLECLAGKAGVGKMKQFNLSAGQVTEFLTTGDLQVSDVAECDNFDRCLYRYISKDEYETILQGVQVYIETGNEYEALYAEVHNATGEALPIAEDKMEAFLGREDLPMYQIYHHNCDTVAREMIALIDEEMNEFNNSKERLTPSANYRQMYRNFSVGWGSMMLGTDTLLEKILW